MSDLTEIKERGEQQEKEAALDALDKRYESKTTAYRELVNTYKKLREEKGSYEAQINDNIDAGKQELVRINAQIEERKKYYNEQEKLINETVETGNDHIADVSYEFKQKAKERIGLEGDVAELSSNKAILTDECQKLEAKLNNLSEQYNKISAVYQKTLNQQKQQILGAEDQLKSIKLEGQTIINKLKEKELQMGSLQPIA